MHCPFLRGATVNYCREAPAAKALPIEAIDAASSRCNGPDFASCPYAAAAATGATAARCPSLVEDEVQYCAAVSTPKFIPSVTMLPSRCRSEAHRHCALFLERSGGRPPAAAASPGGRQARRTALVEGIEVPLDLEFTPHHLWADRGDDGSCTVGADAFLVRVIGHADRVTFGSTWPEARSFAVLSVAGVELPLSFPYPLDRLSINAALRVEPNRLSDDPYGSGWLFEGYWAGEADRAAHSPRRMARGDAAVSWMRHEVEWLSLVLHGQLAASGDHGLATAADGGIFATGVARVLRREDVLHLFSEFFSVPAAGWSE